VIRKLNARRSDENGFTLIEILVVILILAVLMAIAVPSFLRSKKKGNDSQAHAALRSGLAAERTYYVDYQSYTTDQAKLRAIESNVVWDTTDSKVSGVMAVTAGVPADSVVVMASTSTSGSVYCIMNIATDQTAGVNGKTQAGTYYATKSTTVSSPPTSITAAECGSGASTYTRDPTAGWSN
jgi:type IV pilus assembly protein PilA